MATGKTEFTADEIRERIANLERIRAQWDKHPGYQEKISMDIAGLRMLLAVAVAKSEPDKGVL